MKRRWIARPLLVVLGLNLAFLLGQLGAVQLPAEALRSRVRAAFERGGLGLQDRLPLDRKLGWDQWSDCVLLHMVVFRDGSAFADALGPPIFQQLGVRAHWPQCGPLRLAVDGRMPRICPFHGSANSPGCEILRYDYTRYWHGPRVLASALLLLLDVAQIRVLYGVASHLLLVLLGAVILLRARDVWLALLPVPIVGLVASGMAFFGQSLMHAPAFLVVLGGLVLLTWCRGRLRDGPALVASAAALGAFCAFFEFWVGAIPVGAALIFHWVHFLWSRSGDPRGAAWLRLPVACTLAFLGGAALSIGLKLGFASLVFGVSVMEDFARQLGARIAGEGMTLRDVLAALATHHPVLGRGSPGVAKTMLAASALGWSIGGALLLLRAVRRRSSSDLPARDYVAAALAASIVIAWLAFFRNHSSIHAFFMVRTLFVPLALGFAAPCLVLHGALRARV